MSMTVANVLGSATTTGALRILDKEATGRWSDTSTLLPIYNEAVRVIRSKRPDACLGSDGNVVDYSAAAASSETSILPSNFLAACIDYVCARAFEDDARDEQDLSRAKAHMDRFEKEVLL